MWLKFFIGALCALIIGIIFSGINSWTKSLKPDLRIVIKTIVFIAVMALTGYCFTIFPWQS